MTAEDGRPVFSFVLYDIRSKDEFRNDKSHMRYSPSGAMLMILFFLTLFLSQGNALHGRVSTQRTDADILKMLGSARDQADSWVEAYLDDLNTKAFGNAAADKLAKKIGDVRKQQHKWELSVWTVAQLQPEEYIETEMGSGRVLIMGTTKTAAARGIAPMSKADQPLGYVVTAPAEVLSRILMEGLKRDLLDYTELVEFGGSDAESSAMFRAWKSAWFDAQALYCKTNPGGKFTDLNNEAQTCRTETTSKSKQ
jgi:hypothetical protein